jgi:hypothetical protein
MSRASCRYFNSSGYPESAFKIFNISVCLVNLITIRQFWILALWRQILTDFVSCSKTQQRISICVDRFRKIGISLTETHLAALARKHWSSRFQSCEPIVLFLYTIIAVTNAYSDREHECSMSCWWFVSNVLHKKMRFSFGNYFGHWHCWTVHYTYNYPIVAYSIV